MIKIINIKYAILAVTLFFSYFTYAENSSSENIGKIFPVELDSSYIFLNQAGNVIHSQDTSFNQVEFFPFHGVWLATQYVHVPWQKDKIVVDTFFDRHGQVVQMNRDDLIHGDLGKNRFLKYSYKEERYLLTNKQGKLINKLDSRIVEVSPYSSQLALTKIKVSDYKYRYGYLNLKGEWAIQPKYKSANSFEGKYASVSKPTVDYVGLAIDQKGNPIKRADEYSRFNLSNGYWSIAVARNGDKWFSHYIIDPNNNVFMKDVDARWIGKDYFVLNDEKNSSENKGILNTKTKKIVPFDGKIYRTERSSEGDYIWVDVKLSNQKFYRLLDHELNILLEKDYKDILRIYQNYAWIKPAESNKYVLIDENGTQLSQFYDYIELKHYDGSYYSIASNNNDRDQKDILSSSGKRIAYRKYLNSDFYTKHYAVYNAEDVQIWPKYNRFYNTQYTNIADEDNKDYVQSYIRAMNGSKFYIYGWGEVIQGPKTIDINSIAKFNLSEKYLYIKREDGNCHGYIMSKDLINDKWQICIVSNNIGHVNSTGLSFLADDAEQLGKQLVDITNGKNGYIRSKIHDFDWLQKPTFDNEKHTLSWGYEIAHHRRNAKDKKFGHFYANTSLLKFGKSNVIWLNSSSAISARPVSEIIDSFADLIQFNESEDYQKGESFACNALPEGDKTFDKIQVYLPNDERCFAYSLNVLLTGFNDKNYVESEITRFINHQSDSDKIEIK